jgi:hypothetical protein
MQRLEHHRNPKTTLQVKFTCEECDAYVIRPIRIGPNFFLTTENFPPDWRVEVGEDGIKCWCRVHASQSVGKT